MPRTPQKWDCLGREVVPAVQKKGSAPLPRLSPPSTWRDYSARARIYRGSLVGLGPRNPRCVSVESVESCVLAESALRWLIVSSVQRCVFVESV